MFSPDQYELLDFGTGRKLERFGTLLLDRPAPAAEPYRPLRRELWPSADACYERIERDSGEWELRDELPDTWQVHHGKIVFELRRTTFGHIGLFPEQAANWDWVGEQVRSAERTLKVLNLFAYTGGSTLAASSAGAEVVHIDAAKNVVQWARRNAELSHLAERPIRWIAEDALKFVQRELRRGNRYDGVILDPPSYGHGPSGEVWKLAEHLSELLSACADLTAGRREFILLTCHSPEFAANDAGALLEQAFGPGHIAVGELSLLTADERELPSGVMGRWTK